MIDKKELQAIAQAVANNIKTEENLNEFRPMLPRITADAALNVELDTPRERAGSFKPRLVKKHQRRFTSMHDKILFLYAQGMTTREIVTTFKEMYGADVSATLIPKVTDAVIEQVDEW